MGKTATIIVIYEGLNQHTFSGSREDRLTLQPGKNKVDVNQFNRLAGLSGKKDALSSKALKTFLDTGMVRVVNRDDGAGPVANSVDDDVSKMNVDVAVDVIENTMTVEELAIYEKQEKGNKPKPRKTVLAAIDKQREALIEEGGGEEEDE